MKHVVYIVLKALLLLSADGSDVQRNEMNMEVDIGI
jgi:hypothetical protein